MTAVAADARLEPFERVVADHGAVVLRVCRALLNAVDAQDAWSETFLSALQAYPDLPAGSNVRGWLVTIAHRKAIDVHRRGARVAVPIGELPETVSPHGNPGSGHPELWEAVVELPERQRFAVIAHHLAGLPYAEVAALGGGTAAAARRAAADGLAALRRTFPKGEPA